MSTCQEIQELIPAYVLDAVTDQERIAVETHLPRCPDCAQLVAAYRPIADSLAASVQPVEPSADLKYRVLAATMPRAKSSPARDPWFTRLGSALAALFRSPIFSATALVLVVVLALWNFSLHNQLDDQTAANQRFITELSRQRDVMSVMAYGAGQPRQITGTEIAARSTGRLYGKSDQVTFAMVVHGLPASKPGKVYQLWLIEVSGDRTSGGTFTVGEDGYGWLSIHSPKPLGDYQGIGVTEEPAGGSPKPTGPKVMGTNLQ
ncbi:MAG: anti-sigma factor [Chloroflexi bacterium]|nr:anti-sigma factor [Chloroflexota bacterium]